MASDRGRRVRRWRGRGLTKNPRPLWGRGGLGAAAAEPLGGGAPVLPWAGASGPIGGLATENGSESPEMRCLGGGFWSSGSRARSPGTCPGPAGTRSVLVSRWRGPRPGVRGGLRGSSRPRWRPRHPNPPRCGVHPRRRGQNGRHPRPPPPPAYESPRHRFSTRIPAECISAALSSSGAEPAAAVLVEMSIAESRFRALVRRGPRLYRPTTNRNVGK